MQINKDILNFFEEILGPSIRHTKGNYSFKCPKMNHRKSRLWINFETGQYQCFACQDLKGKSFYSLLKKIGASKIKFKQLSTILNDNIQINTINILENQLDKTELKLPKDFWPLSNQKNHLDIKMLYIILSMIDTYQCQL